MSSTTTKVIDAFGMFSSDVLVLVFLIIAIFALISYFGKGKGVSFIISFFLASVLYKSFPFLEKIIVLNGDKLMQINKLFAFIVFLIPVWIIINRFIFSSSEHSGPTSILKKLLLTFSAVVAILIFTYSVVNLDVLYDFSSQIERVFTQEGTIFYWSLASILLLALI